MTVIGSAGVHRDVEGSSRSRLKWLVMAPVFAAVVASVGQWQWRSPDAFGEQGDEGKGLHRHGPGPGGSVLRVS
jgi:hypothetical protein